MLHTIFTSQSLSFIEQGRPKFTALNLLDVSQNFMKVIEL
jgi:hypothetical protein